MSDLHPLTYNAATEQAKPDEASAVAAINAALQGIQETTWHDYGHAVRSVHAKSHGLLQGELRVLDDLPASLAQGMFARPGTYPVVLRISTNPGDILDDTVSSPRGLAMKIIGVEGERLPGSEGATTQDFIMVNGPAFVAPDAQAFNQSLKLLAATTDTGQGWKKVLSGALRTAVTALQAVGADGSMLKALGGQPMTHPLGETFYTQTPFRYGDYIAKLALAPASQNLMALKDAPVDLAGKPNGLRAAVIDFFHANAAEWEMRVQLRTNPDTMPIEDATVPWPEDQSPYRVVARLSVSRQPAWSEARAQQVDDGLSFSPWHGLTAHQPLGSINRARRNAYTLSAGFRASHNRCPIHQPGDGIKLSGDAASIYGLATGREGRRPNTPDARPGAWGQPLNDTARSITSGAIGGLAAGALLSAIFVGSDTMADGPSDLVRLKRQASAAAGWTTRRDPMKSGLAEQVASHTGHLALSAAAGAAYGVAKPAATSPVVAGSLFGAAFYVLTYGMIGPLTGVTPKLSADTRSSIVKHGLFHVLFGVTTALVADHAARRL